MISILSNALSPFKLSHLTQHHNSIIKEWDQFNQDPKRKSRLIPDLDLI